MEAGGHGQVGSWMCLHWQGVIVVVVYMFILVLFLWPMLCMYIHDCY